MNETKHLVKVNDNIEVVIKIPEIITILEFKAISTIVNKLFSASG